MKPSMVDPLITIWPPQGSDRSLVSATVEGGDDWSSQRTLRLTDSGGYQLTVLLPSTHADDLAEKLAVAKVPGQKA
jgi:hypothetical protein